MWNFIFDQNWWTKKLDKKINDGVYDWIYDYVFWRRWVPTYVALNSLIKIIKKWNKVSIKINRLETSRINYWVHTKNNKKSNSTIIHTIYPNYPLSYFESY
jgi:hypothetical protein